MTIREVLTTPDPFLRKRAKKVRSVTPEVKSLIDDMIETMREAPGVGLAAPQVGVGLRVIVAEYREPSEDPEAEPKPPKLHAIVMGEVERYDSITVKGLNRHGKPMRIKAKGWMGRIIQHEIDHLEGVLFIDRATEVWKLEEEEEIKEAPITQK
jgi:peptide deformylase